MFADRCRICLESNKYLKSIFEYDQHLTYAEMILYIANIKILKSETINYFICQQCQKKLRDSYEFKELIIRSHVKIMCNLNIRKLQFNNISEIKDVFCDIKCDPKLPNLFLEQLLENKNNFKYCDTIINKIQCLETQTPIFENFMSDLYETDNSWSEDSSYSVSKKKSKFKKKNVQKTGRKVGRPFKFPGVDNVCIKPESFSKIVRIKFRKPKPQKTYCTPESKICPHCGKMTKFLDNHILIHIGKKKYKCENEKCSKSFYRQSQLNVHIKTHLERDFKCDTCTAAFVNQGSLNRHQRTHQSVKPFVCDICNKAFKKRYTLTTHRLRHTLPMCKCKECGISFYTKDQLRHHIRVHTGERPFRCDLCSQPYSYKHDFNRHCLNKHGVFLKQRQINVMNEETLRRERLIMKELFFQMNNCKSVKEIKNPFEGPFAAMAFESTIKMLKENRIPIIDS